MAAIMALTTGVVYVRSISGTLQTGAQTLGGNLTFAADNTYDIGDGASGDARNIFIDGSIRIGTGGSFTTNARGSLQFQSDGVLALFNNAGTDFARLQFGGTTSSFPALKRNGTGIDVRLADDSAYGDIRTRNVIVSSGTFYLGATEKPVIYTTAPTISSGFGTSPSIVTSNGTAAFTINVGTGGTAQTGVIGLPEAATGWIVHVENLTTRSSTVYQTKQTASTTTSVTIGSFDAAGAASAWVASNILAVTATAY